VKLGLAFALLAGALGACTELQRDLVDDRQQPVAADGGGLDAARPRDAATSGAHSPEASTDAGSTPAARCGKHVCACDNGLDDDQDGLVDGLDPECTGAFDDDEASFATGLPNKQAQCRDCYWDDNSGNGDDGCRYPAECLTGTLGNGKGNCGSCEPSRACIDHCQARTPNGCDCFGCCEVVRPSGEHVFVELVDSCNLQRLDDGAACPRCVPSSACMNGCGRCELCLGKTAADLPSDCRGAAGPGYACEGGLAVCSPTNACQTGLYCQQGCCLVDLL
jgi:hypothetical protein